MRKLAAVIIVLLCYCTAVLLTGILLWAGDDWQGWAHLGRGAGIAALILTIVASALALAFWIAARFRLFDLR